MKPIEPKPNKRLFVHKRLWTKSCTQFHFCRWFHLITLVQCVHTDYSIYSIHLLAYKITLLRTPFIQCNWSIYRSELNSVFNASTYRLGIEHWLVDWQSHWIWNWKKTMRDTEKERKRKGERFDPFSRIMHMQWAFHVCEFNHKIPLLFISEFVSLLSPFPPSTSIALNCFFLPLLYFIFDVMLFESVWQNVQITSL